MNVETFKHLNKPIHVNKQFTKNQPTHPPTTHSKGQRFQNEHTTYPSRHHILN